MSNGQDVFIILSHLWPPRPFWGSCSPSFASRTLHWRLRNSDLRYLVWVLKTYKIYIKKVEYIFEKVKIEQFNSFGENQKVFVNVGGEWRKTTRLWGAIDWIKMTRFRHNQHHNFGESNSFFWLIKFLELRSTKRHNQHHNFGSSNCFFGSSNLWDYNQQEGKYFSDIFFVEVI